MLPFRSRRICAVCALPLFIWGLAAAAQSGTASFDAIVQSANAARDAGNTDAAIRDYQRALALRPTWAEGWWDLGTTEYQANRYADAVSTLRKLTTLAPNSAAGWSILGLSEFETKDYAGALADLEKAAKLGGISDPEFQRVSAYHLGLLLIRAGAFERATTLLHSTFGDAPPQQIKIALGLALLRVPLLPAEVDPSEDALIQAAGDATASGDPLQSLAELVQQYPKTPWIRYAYGRALEQAGQIPQALVQQKLEATISPGSALPWIAMSRLELRLERPHNALSDARRAVSLEPGSAAAHEALAKALDANGMKSQADLEARAATRLEHTPPVGSGRDSRMIALYASHSAPENSGAPTDWNAAMTAYSSGSYAEAITALKSWLESNPNNGTAWAVMGLSEFALKDYSNARIHLERGISLGVKASPQATLLANDRLALLLILDHQFDAASALLSPLAGKPPMASEIRLALGLALLRIPSLPEDLTAEQRELAQSGGAIVELLLASRYTDAFPAFERLIASRPNTPWLHYAYGDALASLSHYDEAKAQMIAETRLSPRSPLPWIRIASIDVRQHQPSDALKAAQTAVTLSPDSAEAHYQLGRALLEADDATKAIAELERANAITPSSPEIHFALARAYTKAHLPRKAAAERATFLQLHNAAQQRQGGAQSILRTNTQ